MKSSSGPAAADAALEQARARLEDNRPADALAPLDALLAREPLNAEAWYLRGTAKLEAQRPAEALADLERAIALDPADPRRHFNLSLAHWALNDVAGCLAALHKAVEVDPHFRRAHDFLARMGLHGPHYSDVLVRIHEFLRPRTYLEIGVDRGASFSRARRETIALGIDPDPHIDVPLGPRQRVFRQTSDEFFAGHDVLAELGGLRLELAFIDGMHWFEFALRDFMNVERLCARDATILVHDVFPPDRQSAERERTAAFWTGDVWRLVLLLRKYRPELSVHTVAAPPSGLAVIRNLDPESRFIRDNLDDLVREYSALDYSTIEFHRAEMLNLHANDWDAIRALFDR